MTGPEHYRKAERLIQEIHDEGVEDAETETLFFREAQVHATLALAAATALHVADQDGGSDDRQEWFRVASFAHNSRRRRQLAAVIAAAEQDQ